MEQCHITRQAFYYHFEDIPALFAWIMESEMNRMLQEALAQETPENGLRCFFIMAINAADHVKRGLDSNYRAELETLLRQNVLQFFTTAVERKNLYPNCTRAEINIALRYHSQAVLGLFQEWTEEDTKQLDQIVHTVWRLMSGEILENRIDLKEK